MTPAISVCTAPVGHPWHGRPLILAGQVEIAWSENPARAELDAEVFRTYPDLAAALADGGAE